MRRSCYPRIQTGVARLCRWLTGSQPSGVAPIDPGTLSPNLWFDINDSTLNQYWDTITSIANGDTTVTITDKGAFSIAVPTSGTSKINVSAWGGGESGVGDDGVAQGGAGGGGGAYGTSTNVAITAGATYSGSVGAGGGETASGQSPNEGGSTSIAIGATTYSVPGGSGTLGGLFSSAVGFASGFSGGDGGGATSSGGGGGGGSAGTAANGNSGKLSSSSTGGAGGVAVTGGGAGGAGGDNGEDGTAGSQPGGAGGGSGYAGRGGAGGDGQVVITFTNPGITVTSGISTRVTVGDTYTIYGNSVGGYNTSGTVVFNNTAMIGSTAYTSSTGASGFIRAKSVSVTENVGFVSDLSGNDNHLTQATSSERMLLRSYGLASVSGADGLNLTTSLAAMSDFTIVSLIRRSESTAAVVWKNSGGGGSLGMTKAGAVEVVLSSSTTTTTGTIAANSDVVVTVRLSSGTIRITATGGLNYSASASGNLTVDRLNGDANSFGYAIKAGLVWNSALTNAQIAGVEAWLTQQHGASGSFT